MKATLFDTETTDLIKNSGVPLSRQPRVVEVYACNIELVDDVWVDRGEIEFRVNPTVPIPAESASITGITTEMVRDLPTIRTHWDEIRSFFEFGDMVVAHNLSYDKAIFDFEQKRISETLAFPWPKRLVCTVEASEFLRGHRLSLIDLHRLLFGEGFEGAHGAKSDVLAMKRCFIQLWEAGAL